MKKMEVYRKYFGATWGRFYSKEQRARLLELFAAAHGALTEDGVAPEIKQAVERIESLRITGLIECRNLILIFNVQGEDDDLMTALGVLRDHMENMQSGGKPVYVTARDWHMAVYDERRPLVGEQAYLACGDGDFHRAIALLEKQSETLDVVECLAVLCIRQDEVEKAYYYLGRLQYLLCDKLHLQAPDWVHGEVARLEALLPPEVRARLDAKVQQAGGGKVPMGFTA